MKKILQIAALLCVMATCCFNSSAYYELVSPPAGLPEELWRMEYCSYQGLPLNDAYPSEKKDVTFVIDNNTIYIKGIFSEYPDSWMRAVIMKDNEVVFDDIQLICELDTSMDDPKPVYSFSGVAQYSWYSQDNTTVVATTTFYLIEQYRHWITCKYSLSADGNEIHSKVIRTGTHPEIPTYSAFWFNTEHKERPSTSDEPHEHPEDFSGFPLIGFRANVQFVRIAGGIDVNNMTEDTDSSGVITYDLYGRRVNSDNLTPGIYIRDGRKILIR